MFLVQVSGASATVVFISTSASRQLGMSTTEALQHSLWELFLPQGAYCQPALVNAACINLMLLQ